MGQNFAKTPLQVLKDTKNEKRIDYYRAKKNNSAAAAKIEEEIITLSTLIGLLENAKIKKVTNQNSDYERGYIKRYRKNLIANSLLDNKKFRDRCLSELAILSDVTFDNLLPPKERESIVGEDAKYAIEALKKFGVKEYKKRIQQIESNRGTNNVVGFVFSNSPRFKSEEDKEKIRRILEYILT